MKIFYNIQIWREGKMFVSYVPELDISSCGKTTEQARHNIEEAAELFLEEAKKIGTLKEILQEAGFEKRGGEWDGPQFIAIEKKEVALV